MGKTVSKFFSLGWCVGLFWFFFCLECILEKGSNCTKLLGKMKNKERLQAVGEGIGEVFITPAS